MDSIMITEFWQGLCVGGLLVVGAVLVLVGLIYFVDRKKKGES